jgi:hypothetical protein
MNGGNNIKRKLKIIGVTITAMQEIYHSPLPDQDKCDKIMFLISKLFETLDEKNSNFED